MFLLGLGGGREIASTAHDDVQGEGPLSRRVRDATPSDVATQDDGTVSASFVAPVPVATLVGNVASFIIVHPTQSRFTCPVPRCDLSYPAQPSLVRHMATSHGTLSLQISYTCAMCPYVHDNKRSISLHFRHAHGVAPAPIAVDGSREQACPHCPLTFPVEALLFHPYSRKAYGRSLRHSRA